jgi:hypothetical protein
MAVVLQEHDRERELAESTFPKIQRTVAGRVMSCGVVIQEIANDVIQHYRCFCGFEVFFASQEDGRTPK